MDKTLQSALENNPEVCGFIVADCNGLLITAKGELADKGHLAGRFTAMARKAQGNIPFTNPPTQAVDGQLVVETSGSKRLAVKKVGEFTIIVLSQLQQAA